MVRSHRSKVHRVVDKGTDTITTKTVTERNIVQLVNRADTRRPCPLFVFLTDALTKGRRQKHVELHPCLAQHQTICRFLFLPHDCRSHYTRAIQLCHWRQASTRGQHRNCAFVGLPARDYATIRDSRHRGTQQNDGHCMERGQQPVTNERMLGVAARWDDGDDDDCSLSKWSLSV